MFVETQTSRFVHGLKLSSVVPARTTGDNTVHELTNADLLMKLHYLRGVYYFPSEAVNGLTAGDLKKPMFHWLELYYPCSGRIRGRESGGRPVVKCNDGGVRIVEARSDKTVEEWLEMEARDEVDEMELVYYQPLGPDLGFSPLIYVQFTWFACGGVSVGLSWAHVLGDAFSATAFINMWGHIMAGHTPPESLHIPSANLPVSQPGEVPSIKKVDPVGNYWANIGSSKLESRSVRVTRKQLDLIVSDNKNSEFETLVAMIWKSLFKIREKTRLSTVTICMTSCPDRTCRLPQNNMNLNVVEADFSVSETEVSELAARIAKAKVASNVAIQEMAERPENENFDFIVYGANLTFVNLEGADLYGLELGGRKPVSANYFIDGVGDEGAVLIMPWRENGKDEVGDGRTVTMILPAGEVEYVKKELKKIVGVL